MTDNSKISAQILAAIATLAQTPYSEITADTQLIGDGSVLDSMKLVELCLQLEDMASDLGFDFDWTSESAMSRSRGIFRSVGSLTGYFIAQLEAGA
jgi:acyl carrier protein